MRYHQATYGGKVSILKKFHEEVIEQPYDLDVGLEQSTFTKSYCNKIEVVNRQYPELNLARPQIYWVATETVIYDFCDLDFVDKILETTKPSHLEEVIYDYCNIDFVEPKVINSKWIEDEQKYYILNVSDCATLKNGFRYIKELLLQHHNFKMYRDYQTLTANGIDVFSVKN